MIPFSLFGRRRKSQTAGVRLRLQPLEERATPAAAVYNARWQTLTITAAEGDEIDVAALGGQPTGYIQVTETQANDVAFDSSTAGQAVRNLVVNFRNSASGGFTLEADVQLGGNLTIYGAGSSQTVDLAGTVGGNVTYAGNILPAFDEINFESTATIGRNLSLALGSGANTVRIKGGTIHGNLSIRGGADEDTVEFTEAGDVAVDGSAYLNLGSGNNIVLGRGPVGIAFTVHVGLNFNFIGGSGNDKFDFDISGTSLDVGRDATFSLGTRTVFDGNVAAFEALRAGRNISFSSGIGNDTVSVSGALEAKGNVSLSLGAGDNSFDSNVQGIGANSISGSFNYVGGPNGDLVSLDATTIGRSVSVVLGDSNGANQGAFVGLKSPTGVTVYGAAAIAGGSGADGIVLRRLYVGNGLTVRAGAGADTVAFDDLSVGGATWIDLAAGDDLLQGEMLSIDGAGSLSNSSTFGGVVTIRGGDGDDTVNLSDDGNASTLILFGGRVRLQGGAGSDTLNNAPENVFNATGNFSDLETVVGVAVV